jgi:PleD family two-component response regulator
MFRLPHQALPLANQAPTQNHNLNNFPDRLLQKEAPWRDIPVIVITSLDLDAKDRERLNAGVQFVLVKERFQPVDLVERIRRLVHSKPAVSNRMEAAS